MRPGILVVAKAPVAGEAKTRLGAQVGFRVAADVAGACLLDTLDACEEAFPHGRRVLALSGELELAARSSELIDRLAGWRVVRQRGHGLGARLAAAHRDAAMVLGAPVVQIGTDTPQVSPDQLQGIARQLSTGRCDAVLGPALDGGWWTLGLVHPRWAGGLADVPMSTARTGDATRAMLARGGARVATTEPLRDIDTMADAEAVSRAVPQSRFADAWRRVVLDVVSPAELFDAALAGASCILHGMPRGPVQLPIAKWRANCDSTDNALLAQCSGPTLDVGCGPGRLTHGLALRGVAALGIDVAPRAVRQTRDRGAHALRRDVFGPVPGSGRWESVLLADGNIGIGGDPTRLLARVRDLLAPGGRAVVEVECPGTELATHQVHIQVGGRLSSRFGWAVLGPEALAVLAREASMRMLTLTEHTGRWFARLEKAST